MFKRIALLVLIATSAIMAANAQNNGKVTGKVIDGNGGEPIEYATVALLKADSSMANGTVTADNGSFSVSVPEGKYILRVSFMGFKTYYHPSQIAVTASKTTKVGTVKISQNSQMMEQVVVKAERSMVDYQLDKRVVNVDKNIVAGGGTATDVLENVPSVAIDNDGNVTLRGSTNVKVLINDRPYELLGSDLETLLEQIPASSIENVEVVTNPSAKYDPEGMSGIINLKLKENTVGAKGLNGVVNLNFGSPLPKFVPTSMATINLNYNTGKWGFFLSADAGVRSHAHNAVTYLERFRDGAKYSADSLFEDGVHSNYMGSVKVGGEYHFNEKTTLALSYQLRGGNRVKKNSIDNYDYFSTNHFLDYTQTDTNSNKNRNHALNLNFIKKFDEKDRMLTADVTFNIRGRNGDGRQEQFYPNEAANLQNYYLRNSETENSNRNINMKLDYVHPFAEKFRLETGYEGRVMNTNQNYVYYLTENDNDSVWNLQKYLDERSSTHFDYGQNIHAIYATLGWKVSEKFSALAGLRGEYSAIYGEDKNHPDIEPVKKEYWELYPTLHMSYTINENQSVQLSYSRRVRRPHMWDLHPYLDVREGQQLSFGNPYLDPEFTNSFELSYNVAINKVNIFTSAYFRQTNNMMTRYGFVWDAASAAYYSPWMGYNPEYDGYWASTWQNLNRGLNYGLEFIVDWQIAKWWKVNVSVNLYESMIEGTELLDNQDKNAFRASGKFNSFMMLPKDWTIQFSGQYRAPFMDLQTDMLASYWADLAVKKDIMQKRATISLRVGDVFCTGGFGHTTDNEQMYRVMRSKRLSPSVTIGFSYKINNGLKQNRREGSDDDHDDEGSSDY
ncbi:MAG: TonB-dependent receptor [Bacteroidales bacterium]|nr:TonB-dependent receptor [Bacteroidales bacterium]